MRQAILSNKNDQLKIVEVHLPANRGRHLLVRIVASLVSKGAEKHILEMIGESSRLPPPGARR
ncbi:MAG: hypothetical protein DRO11_08265 [Methanobacteriota archaeon]|nr:MAG: hypothetical protein DRO11_08265 [Euryarchaeota archaeon]